MQHPGWILVVIGLVIAGIGAGCWLRTSRGWGELPGDIAVERPNFRFYFPVVTCVVLSLVLTGVLWLVRFFQK